MTDNSVIVLIEAHICEVEVLLVVTNRSGEWKVAGFAICCELHCVHLADLKKEKRHFHITSLETRPSPSYHVARSSGYFHFAVLAATDGDGCVAAVWQ